jgi:2-oxoglutarate ferredoxin oxidoreductase subunit beta
MSALNMLADTCCGGILVTGLIYINEEQPPLNEIENLVDTPLAYLSENQLRPSEESLVSLMQTFR